MKKWKIFYTDGDTFDSSQGGPEESFCEKPVAVIVQEDGRCGRRILKFMDWYRWSSEHERWFDCEQFDVLQALCKQKSVIARRGEYMAEEAFQKILIAAHDDPFIKAVSPSEPPHPAWRKDS